jgi:8-oxo-dGTP pyrophosphatase MutT (NUDIX family)
MGSKSKIINQKSKKYQFIDLKRGVDYIGVNCAFFCHDKADRILFHKRSVNCRDEHGRWDPGAGSMEIGETFEETVRREVMEEYGVEPLEIEYIATENVLRDNNGQITHWIKNLHWVLVKPEQVKNNDPEKIDEIGWFAFDNLPDPLHSQAIRGIDSITKHLKSKRRNGQ